MEALTLLIRALGMWWDWSLSLLKDWVAVLKQPPRNYEAISWKLQGLGRALTVKKLREECARNNPSIIFLRETRMKTDKLCKIRKACKMDEEFYVDPRGSGGGLAVWWTQEVMVNVWYSSRNIIHVSIDSNYGEFPKYVSFVYGAHSEVEKMQVWNKMRNKALGMTASFFI